MIAAICRFLPVLRRGFGTHPGTQGKAQLPPLDMIRRPWYTRISTQILNKCLVLARTITLRIGQETGTSARPGSFVDDHLAAQSRRPAARARARSSRGSDLARGRPRGAAVTALPEGHWHGRRSPSSTSAGIASSPTADTTRKCSAGLRRSKGPPAHRGARPNGATGANNCGCHRMLPSPRI